MTDEKSMHTPHTPIDDSPQPPPQQAPSHDTLTRDLTSALERMALALVDRVAQRRGIGRRAAAAIVIERLRVQELEE